MHALRHKPGLSALIALLMAVGMLVQSLAMPSTAMLVDGICHADPGSTDQQPADHATHDLCCLLCNLPTPALADTPPRLAPPAVILVLRDAPAVRERAIHAPAPAAYAARAPPHHA